MKVWRILLLIGVSLAAGAALTFQRRPSESNRLVTGKFITAAGEQTEVGSSPINMKLSPDGKYIAVTDCGFREQLSIIDVATGKVVGKRQFVGDRNEPSGLYYGLAFSQADGKTLLYVSRGAQDLISIFEIGTGGSITSAGSLNDIGPDNPANLP